MNAKKLTASYRILPDRQGNRYRFFCDLSGGAGYTTPPIRGATQDEELRAAWKEGQAHFNQCRKCGRWVCDAMFNADVLDCVDCAPWEDRPRYCCKCGAGITAPDTYCRHCGARLQYGEVWK